VWEIVKLNKKKKKSLVDLQTTLIESKQRLLERVNEFIDSKNKLTEESARIGEIVEKHGLSIFSPKKAANLILWVNSVPILFHMAR